jgi:ABC-type Zn uptake system ZnuABC Zn-binding protein ZnuA
MPKRSIAALSAAIVFLIFDTPLALTTPVKVVATLPILKEFAEQVGREHVQVTSLISGFESEHSYSPKPSDLKAIGEARLLLEIGLGLEVWVGGLVKNAANSRLRVVTTSHDIAIIRDASEPNSPGNPHIWLDPENAKIMTRHIADGLMEADPAHTTDYRANLDDYVQRLTDSERELQLLVATLGDRRIVTYHPAWPYFARRFGFRIEGDIVGQVGAEPTAAHLARLARRMKSEKIKVIVSEPQLNQKVAQALAGETGARIVLLSPLPGAITGTNTYLSMLRYDIAKLVDALQS